MLFVVQNHQFTNLSLVGVFLFSLYNLVDAFVRRGNLIRVDLKLNRTKWREPSAENHEAQINTLGFPAGGTAQPILGKR
jgi:hypothetical protein